MPTPEEIKKIKVEVSDRLYSIYGFSTAVKAITCRTIDEILEDYCIVPKSKVLDVYADAVNEGKHAHVKHQIQSWTRLRQLETLFGKSLFEEEK